MTKKHFREMQPQISLPPWQESAAMAGAAPGGGPGTPVGAAPGPRPNTPNSQGSGGGGPVGGVGVPVATAGGAAPATAGGSGGMDELLPLVLQLINAEQVKLIIVCAMSVF